MHSPPPFDLQALVYVDNINSNLICCICHAPFIHPVSLPLCGHTFCFLCINQALSQSATPTCPIDRSAASLDSLKPAVKIVCNMVGELLVRCPNTPCPEVCQRQLMEHHVREDCKFSAKSAPPAELPNAIVTEDVTGNPPESGVTPLASIRTVKCTKCNADIAEQVKTEHVLQCPAEDVTCTFCQSPCRRGELSLHHVTCPKFPVLCPHSEYGCTWGGSRQELATYHLDASCAFEPLKAFLTIQSKRFESVERQNRELHSRWTDTRSELARLRAEVQSSESSVASPPADTDISAPSIPSAYFNESDVILPSGARMPLHQFHSCYPSLPIHSPSLHHTPGSFNPAIHHSIAHDANMEIYRDAGPSAVPFDPIYVTEEQERLKNQIETLTANLASLELKSNVTWMQECLRLREEVQALRSSCHTMRLQITSLMMMEKRLSGGTGVLKSTKNTAPSSTSASAANASSTGNVIGRKPATSSPDVMHPPSSSSGGTRTGNAGRSMRL